MYPNPASSESFYDITLEEDETGQLEIFNSFGQSIEVYLLYSGENHVRVNLSGLSSGIYLYRVSVNGEAKISEQLIISK